MKFSFSDAAHGILINHKIDERRVDPVWRAIKIEITKIKEMDKENDFNGYFYALFDSEV